MHQHRHSFEYLMTMRDGHTETWAYQARYYTVEVITPANFVGTFTRDNYTVHGRPTFEDVVSFIRETGPWDAILCYGPFGAEAWPQVRAVAGSAVMCLDYAGGPLCDVNGQALPTAPLFDHVFVAHETQARFLRDRGVSASKARGVPTNIYRPIPGTPKLWHVLCPNTFVPGKRNPLVAQYCEQFAPTKPSLFIGHFETPAVVDMTLCGGIPLNKTGIAQRNNIQIGPRAPAAVMPLLYNASEVCVVGSQEEAGPWVALEALACGVPTIIMEDCAWFVAEAFGELARTTGGLGIHVVPPDPVAIHAKVEVILGDYAQQSDRARLAVVGAYDWWGQYQETDATLKRLVGLKQAGQVLA